ncbi:MAG: penicillin-binding protein [Lysobacterales bacterium 69-70]|nr:penicillin-binding protein 1A [Xanthomonadaceae bacterium]ODU35269.1 MAG: penicillin-binding protein [Xanthomonadaceae bacterium SCN 69-320]ODV17265.1 MAG: penicillin-binding protein [Xanthomonadaceae bacterium SCN 69-25]OJY94168.1 MAG: penicillin-binding protein [Xanthomonadales bacterium 69-70]
MRVFLRLTRYALYLALTGIVLGCAAIGVAYWLISPRLPSVETLRDVRLQVPLRVYTADDKLIATFGETRRIPVAIENVPAKVKNAFLAAEDARFYDHPGFDVQGIFRAVWHLVRTGGDKGPGGSTITQQVARNFFLSPEQTYTRKISELFLALRIERALSKDEILSLYLNKIFLGHRAYGVGAAAEFYYGKTLDQLELGECAMLASLPKFPSTGNPLFNRKRAEDRRNYVLARMFENNFISEAEMKAAMAEPDKSYAHEPPIEVEAPYLAEMVRVEALDRLGADALTDGYNIRTTLDSRMQDAANQAVRNALIDYDRRHGYRGAEAHVDLAADATPEVYARELASFRPLAGLIPALVTETAKDHAQLYLADGQAVVLDKKSVEWARPYQSESSRGAAPKSVDAVVKVGDIVRVARGDEETWTLAQLPAAQAALVSLDPDDGAIRALVGGFSFGRSKFNRATQSARQPGSSFKPFLYAAAFEHGFTPASILNDAPLVFPDPSRPDGIWAPSNDDDKFEGPMRLREALVKSVNLISVRLLDAIGVRYAREFITRFGLPLEAMPENLSMSLGTASVAPLMMARGYSVFANGGMLVDPYFVASIRDRDGKDVYVAQPPRACRGCPERLLDDARLAREAASPALPNAAAPAATTPSGSPRFTPISSANAAATPVAATEPGKPRLAPRTLDVRTAHLVSSLMRDVIRRGTGRAAMDLKRNDLAGKTGTTNDHRDAWFSGFNDQLVTSVWVGFDDFSSLGRGEFGAKAALPIWIDYMRVALDGKPETPFVPPPGISTARIDPATGYLASSDDSSAILEIFKSEDIERLSAPPPESAVDESHQGEAYDIF